MERRVAGVITRLTTRRRSEDSSQRQRLWGQLLPPPDLTRQRGHHWLATALLSKANGIGSPQLLHGAQLVEGVPLANLQRSAGGHPSAVDKR